MGRSFRHSAVGKGSSRLSLALAVGVSAVSAVADAQTPQARPAPMNAPLVVHRDPAAEAIAVGRARMAKGDYAGALEAFDAAMRTSVDPTVRRDRGLCHEQLGHPFPAMDDLRAYLTVLPDAPDAEDIRSRLNQLETANGFGGTGTGAAAAGTGGSTAVKPVNSNEDPFAVDPNDPNAKAAEPVAGSGGVRAGNYDQELAANEEWDQAEGSPLRRGSGMVFGVYGRGYAGSTGGVSGYGAGATIRGSLGSVSTLYGEIGYVSYRAGSDDATGEREGGLGLGFGYEARIRFDQFGSNALILAGTVSYERVTQTTLSGFPVVNIFDPRFKLGYRHVFGPGLGIELGGEVAEPLAFASSSQSGSFTTFGGTLAILVGF
jgi:hypothetical protein